MTIAPQPSAAPEPPATSLATRLARAVVTINGDLDVSRQVMRDGPCYVVRDPVSFSAHQLTPREYAVMSAIGEERTLGEIVAALVADGTLEAAEEESFYEFVLELHRRGLVVLPINDADRLYDRYERKRAATRRSRILGVLFLRVPLVNPDRFLDRTIGLVRWAFTRVGLAVWLGLVVTATVIALGRLDDLTSPVLTMLSGGNLLLLWVSLIGLKVIHELGHAYACKASGGHVPEMGAYFVLFTPCAYVDASDSWAFTRTRERAIVTLGGLYFESFVGALAMIVWAFTSPSLVNTVAYQVVLLSTVVTVGFNLNPLMRYDAYYLLSDLTRIPNLRSRARGVLVRAARWLVLGIRDDAAAETSRRRAAWLGCFGAAQLLYRIVLTISIAALLAFQLGAVGALIAAGFVLMSLAGAGLGVARTLLAPELSIARRIRGIVVALVLAGGCAALVAMVPVRTSVQASGIASRSKQETLRASIAGTIASIHARRGEFVDPGGPIVSLDCDELNTELEVARAEERLARARITHATSAGPAEVAPLRADLARLASRRAQLEHRSGGATLRSEAGGRVAEVLVAWPGERVEIGDPVATIVSGPPRVHVLVNQEERDLLELAPGDAVLLRSVSNPMTDLNGTVEHIEPVGHRALRHPSLGTPMGGPIPVDPATGLPAEPLFEIVLALPEGLDPAERASFRVRLPARSRTIGDIAHRRLALFLSRIDAEGVLR